MKIMAIDLGDARTGIAVCDPTEFLASPLTVIHEKDREILLEKIKELAESEKAEELVMGYPRNMNGTIGERAVLAEGDNRPAGRAARRTLYHDSRA